MTKLAYDLNAAADLCSVSRDTIDRAINSGALKAVAVGWTKTGRPSKRLILAADLAAWVEGLTAA